MLNKSHFSTKIPQLTARKRFEAIDDALSASSSTNARELTHECHRLLPFHQATIVLEVTRHGQTLDSFSMDKGPFAYMTCTCEARGLIFTVRISIFQL